MPTRQLFSSLLILLLCFAVQQKASATVQVSVHPARAPLTLTQTQQFTATVAGTTNTGVIWFVDGSEVATLPWEPSPPPAFIDLRA